ncbi:MAG: ABC transporter ATP-binding protein [Bacillota bacterium]|nr:ABC transporter ATP-binding protein [Bacillota bacterium]
MNKLLEVNNLIVSFTNEESETKAVKGVSLSLNAGETLALVGESGSGKTVLCKSMMHLLCTKGGIRQGSIKLYGKELAYMSEGEIRQYRGGDIAMVFQDPMVSLDPAHSVGEQIAESVRIHCGRQGAKQRAIELMKLVDIKDAEKRYNDRPYQFSGGMRQRIVIAVALAGNPKLLLADEPTTALDEETQADILKLLKSIKEAMGLSMLFITHDLSLVEEIASRVAIMRDGHVVEEGDVRDVFFAPREDYTRKLLGYLDYKKNRGHNHRLETEGEAVLTLDRISKSYGHKKVFDNFSLTIGKGEIVGLIGRSGCGKSTLSRCIMGIETPDNGSIKFAPGIKRQIIFQDSQSAFNDRMSVKKIVGEPLRIGKCPKREIESRVQSALKAVGIGDDLYNRRPYELSGGQRQRVAIARALITEPDFILADEPLTGLDVSAQADIVHLLRKLVTERGLTLLFIAHDLPMVNHISNRVVRMG